MPAPSLPTSAAAPHNNHQLFSDYYLNALLPGNADWQAMAEPARGVKAELRALFAGYTPSDKEAQLEREVIIPALTFLGHTFEVQAALKTPDGTKKPDYVFYADRAALNAHKNKTLTDALPRQGGLAVGDAKYWERPLDMTIQAKSNDPFSNKNPSYQIAFYIQHSGVDEWEAWFTEQRAEHGRRTAQIVAGEEELNGRVYALFGLTAAEREVVEAQTKYRYGEV